MAHGMGIFSLFRTRVQPLAAEIDLRLLDELQQIGQIKNTLPIGQRSCCNELGLFVQLREARGMHRLQAGGKWKSQLDIWQDAPGKSWTVRKYQPGQWEASIGPTLQLARWLGDRLGLPEDVMEDFHSSIRRFQATGALYLPQNFHSVGATTELGQMIDAIREDNVADFLPKIQGYVARHRDDAPAWDCLRRVSYLAEDYRQAWDASLQAAQLAPNDGVIRYEAASICLAALSNQLRNSRGLDQLTPARIRACTLEALGLTYEEAYSAMWHHLKAAIETSMK
ncbi:MAG: hypothetical protein ABID84_01995 [Chloroflexota bacterium]